MANDFKRMWTEEEIKKMGGGVTEEQFEELVRATPTDVSIIEDQGKLELMLEHDGNVLAINDTPNQFLQRRLDKPSKVITIPANENGWDVVNKFTGVGYRHQIVTIDIQNEDEGVFNAMGWLNNTGDSDGINIVVLGVQTSMNITQEKILAGSITLRDYNGMLVGGIDNTFDWTDDEITLDVQANYDVTIKFF